MLINRLFLGLCPLVTAAVAEPLHLGPFNVKANIYEIAVEAKMTADASISTSTSTISTQVSGTAAVPRKSMKQLATEILRSEVHEIPFGNCKAKVAQVRDTDLDVTNRTAILSATFDLQQGCTGPSSITIHVKVAPRIEKGGVLTCDLGDVQVELPSLWSVLNGTVSKDAKTAIAKEIRSISYKLPDTGYGKFALQAASLDKSDTGDILLMVKADSLQTQAQLNDLIQAQLDKINLQFPLNR